MLTDNCKHQEVTDQNVMEVALDYYVIRVNRGTITVMIQLQVPEFAELTL